MGVQFFANKQTVMSLLKMKKKKRTNKFCWRFWKNIKMFKLFLWAWYTVEQARMPSLLIFIYVLRHTKLSNVCNKINMLQAFNSNTHTYLLGTICWENFASVFARLHPADTQVSSSIRQLLCHSNLCFTVMYTQIPLSHFLVSIFSTIICLRAWNL